MRYRLEELFDLQMGKTPARANLDYWNGCNKWVSISDLSGYDKYVTDTKECISDLGVSESGIKAVPKNTVIMSFKLSIGKTAITTEEVYTNEAIMAFIDKGVCEINTDYLYYLFSGMDWNKGTNKAVLGLTLNKATLSKKEVDIPDLHTQNEVVKKLDSLSNVIQLQKQSLDKLDELIKSRFVEMFGDPSVNPMGWENTTVGNTCYYIKDGPHKSLPDVGEGNGYPFISVRNIVNGYIDFSTARYISKEDYADSIKKCHPQKGDMLYSKGGTTGIAKLIDVDIEFANWVHLAVLKFDETLNGVFFESMLNSDYCYKQSQRLTKGIANRDLVLSAMAKIKMIKPPIELQNQFADFVTQAEKQKATVQQSIDKLETLKKSLMQEYFG